MKKYQPNKVVKVAHKNNLEKKPDNKELRQYAEVLNDKKHPFNKVPKEPKLNIENIFIKKNKNKKAKSN